ncbi:MAG: hypothetical protein KAS32_22640 [Candidatus Peribacteraceae bacterium]|nr:hypothetical protein [Candidatus Peribacteraceae bacterium]
MKYYKSTVNEFWIWIIDKKNKRYRTYPSSLNTNKMGTFHEGQLKWEHNNNFLAVRLKNRDNGFYEITEDEAFLEML